MIFELQLSSHPSSQQTRHSDQSTSIYVHLVPDEMASLVIGLTMLLYGKSKKMRIVGTSPDRNELWIEINSLASSPGANRKNAPTLSLATHQAEHIISVLLDCILHRTFLVNHVDI
jgi:hypothetical protein